MFLIPVSKYRYRYLLCLAVLLCGTSTAYAQTEEPLELVIADPYIELHTGPGARYPIFHVLDRGQSITILKRKTRWYKIRSSKNKTGWVSEQQLQQTLLPDGQQIVFVEADKDSFVERKWELGVTTGELEKAPALSVYGGYLFTENLSSELTFGHAIGNVSSSNILKLNMLIQPYPAWRFSPFFTLGAGVIQVKPNATLINPADKKNAMSQVGFGFKTYLSRKFILRFEYNQYVIFSANNDKDANEDISEWKIGFALFF